MYGREKKLYTFSPFNEKNSWKDEIQLLLSYWICLMSEMFQPTQMCLKLVLVDLLPAGMTMCWKSSFSICTYKSSINIGCNNSLFARLVEEHLDLIPLWCIIQQLELTIKESIGKGLLNDIKECWMKLYCLCNKITKKFRSLQELADELDGLMDLTDNIFENSSVTLIRTCGARWIGHLVKELQRAVNIFEVYYSKTSIKREKSENKDKMFWQC